METPAGTFTLITGASSGIGKAMAFECGSRKMDLLLVALPDTGLADVGTAVAAQYGVSVHIFETDLCETDGPQKVYDWCEQNNYPVSFLINNAGKAGTAVFATSDLQYSDERILLNIRALVLLTRLFTPVMLSLPRARVLNVGSLSAFFPVPYKSIYSATKGFVVQFSRAINAEFRGTGLSVSVVCPNGVRTNAGTNFRIDSHGWVGRITEMSAEDVARISVTGALRGKKVIIPGAINRFLLFLQRTVPSRIQENILIREFNKEVKVS